jgi:hypothetical protein
MKGINRHGSGCTVPDGQDAQQTRSSIGNGGGLDENQLGGTKHGGKRGHGTTIWITNNSNRHLQ